MPTQNNGTVRPLPFGDPNLIGVPGVAPTPILQPYSAKFDPVDFQKNAFTDFAASIINSGFIPTMQGVANIIPIVAKALPGQTSDFINTWQNTVDKWATDLQAPYTRAGQKSFFDDPSINSLFAGIGSAIGSVGAFVGLTALAAETGGASLLGLSGRAAMGFNAFVGGSTLMTNAVYQSAKESGIEDQDAARFAGILGPLLGASELFGGAEAMMLFRSGAGKSVIKNAVKEYAPEFIGKELTMASVGKAVSGITKTVGQKIGSLAISGAKIAGEEATQEGAQQYLQSGFENLYDKFYAKQGAEAGKGKFGTDVLSAETLKSAAENAFYGAIVGGMFGLAHHVGQPSEDGMEQGLFGFIQSSVKLGQPENISKLKDVVNRMVTEEQITPEQGRNYTDNIDRISRRNESIWSGITNSPARFQAFQLLELKDQLTKRYEGLKQQIAGTDEAFKSQTAQLPELYDKAVKALNSTLTNIGDKNSVAVVSPELVNSLGAINAHPATTEKIDTSRMQDAVAFHDEIQKTEEPNPIVSTPQEAPQAPIAQTETVQVEKPIMVGGKNISVKWKPKAELERIGTKLFNNEKLTTEERAVYQTQSRAVEAVLKKKIRDKVFSRVPETPEEVVLQFFASGNRISKKDIGLFINKKDLNRYIWAWANKGQSVDQFEQLFPPGLSTEVKGMGYQGLSNLIGETLLSHSGRASMFQRLVDLQKMEEPQVVPTDAITKDYTEADAILAELSESEREYLSDHNIDENIIFDAVDQLTDNEVQDWFDILDKWEKKDISEQDLNDYKKYIYGEYTQVNGGEANGGKETVAQTPNRGTKEENAKKITHATKEGKKQEGNQPEHIGTGTQRKKTQSGSGDSTVGGLREGQKISQEAEINDQFAKISQRYKDVTVREAINPAQTETGEHPEYKALAQELGYSQEDHLKNSINKIRRESGLPTYSKMGDIPIQELIDKSRERAIAKANEISTKKSAVEATKEKIVEGYAAAKTERAIQLHKSTKVENIKQVYDKVLADVALFGEGKMTLEEATTVGGEPFFEWFRKKHTPSKKSGLRTEEYKSMRAAYELAVSKAKEAVANKGLLGNQQDIVFQKYGTPRKVFALISQKPSVHNAIVGKLKELYPEIQINTSAELPKGILGRANNDSVRRVVEWSMASGRLDTAPHEYAHHYVDMFRNYELVKEGIEKYSEEGLVQAMGEEFVKRSQLTPVQRFAARVWAFIRSIFGSNDLVTILSDAFYKGEALGVPIETNSEFEAFQKAERFSPYETDKKYRESVWNSLINGVDADGNKIRDGMVDEVNANTSWLQKYAESGKPGSNVAKMAVNYVNGSAQLGTFMRMVGGKFGELYNSIGKPLEYADNIEVNRIKQVAYDTVKDAFNGNEKKTSWLSGKDVNKVKVGVTVDGTAEEIEMGEGQLITTYLGIKQGETDFIFDDKAVTLTDEQSDAIVKQVESDKATMDMISKAQDAINTVGEQADLVYAKFGGHGNFEKGTFPLRRGEKAQENIYGRERRTIADMRIENVGSGPVRIEDFGETFDNYINRNAAYAAYAVPIQTAKEFIRRTAVQRKGSKAWADLHQFLAKVINDLEDPTYSIGPEGRWIQKAKNMIARSWLALNPWTGFKQLPGLYVSASVINAKYLLKAAPEMITTWGKGTWKWKVSSDLTDATKRYSANSVLYRSRVEAAANRITGEDTGRPWDAVINPLNGKEFMTTFRVLGKEIKVPKFLSSTRWLENLKVADVATFTTIAKAVELEMADTNPELIKDSPEYWQHFNDRFYDIVNRTQPMYGTVNRTAFARSANPVMQVLTMFSSQQQVNFNLMMESIVDFSRNQSTENLTRLSRTFGTAIVMNALLVAAIDTGRSVLYGYDDDDNKKVMDFTFNTISGTMGTMFGLREITDAALAKLRNKPWQNGASHPVLDIIDQTGSLIGDAINAKGAKALNDATKTIIQWNGLPLSFYTIGRTFYKKGTEK